MRLTTGVVLTLIFFIVHGTLPAQNFNFQSYTVEQGMSQSQNKKVFLDSRGYLWFGSFEGGISKYDGSIFTNYTEKHGLINNKVRAIAEDAKGNLWIGTEDGVSIFDGKKFKKVTSPENETFSILSIAPDYYGNMWIGTQRNGLFYHSENSQVKKVDLGSPYNSVNVRSIKTENNVIYINTDAGFIQGKISDSSHVQIEFSALSETRNSAFLKYSEETILLGAFEGLFMYEQGEIRKFNEDPILANADIRDLFKDSRGNIWIATYGKGIYLIENFGLKNQQIKRFGKKDGLLHNRVLSIGEDLNGNIWFCTYGGVNKFLGQAFVHITAEQGLSNNLVWDVKVDSKNKIWIAHNEGLSSYDGKTIKNFSPKDGFKARKSSEIIFDAQDKMYIATHKGLYIYDKGKFSKPSFPGNPDYLDLTLLFIDKSNQLWIGGEEKIYTLDLNEYSFQNESPSTKDSTPPKVQFFANSYEVGHSVINAIWQDTYGLYWFATDGGGITIYDGENFKRITKKDGLPSNTINYIEEDQNGDFWLATSLAGIVKLSFVDRENFRFKLRYLSEDEGLASNNIYSLLLSDSVLWAGTERGINKITLLKNPKNDNQSFDIAPLTGYDIEFYGSNEGFTAIEANHKAVDMDRDGNIWWGTIKGITKYSPAYDYIEGKKIKCDITGISLFFEDIDWADKYNDVIPWVGLPTELNLPYHQNHITFKYNGINYRNSQRIRYKYILEGFDKAFSPAQRKTEAVYSNISPGTYTFKVMANAGKGYWDEQLVASYNFTIKKPYWMTWWFIGMCATLAFGGVYGVIAVRTYRLKMQKLNLTQKVKERTFQIEKQKQEIEAHLDEIEAQRDQLAIKSETLEQIFTEIEKKNNQITSSINYARRIQQAILPLEESIKEAFPESFILYKARDIVSGDFYWFSDKGKKKIIATVDCTGHGVPGAFMSMIGYALLNQIINENEVFKPSDILYHLHEGIKEALKQEKGDLKNTDGMDVALCSIDTENSIAEFAGAKRPLYLVRKKELTEIKGSKYSIGGGEYGSVRHFENQTFKIQKEDHIYLSTDGYADQFGGSEDKKLMTKTFKNILVGISNLNCNEQKQELNAVFEKWKCYRDQTDDILVIGLRV